MRWGRTAGTTTTAWTAKRVYYENPAAGVGRVFWWITLLLFAGIGLE